MTTSHRLAVGIAVALLAAIVPLRAGAATPSFEDFDRRARAGEALSVVFFGASLTWGANATDPQLTSYRAQIADRLRAKYPEARWRFWDAAIGGTGSQLGAFRLQRDVLARRPDLVLLDFSANDDIYSDDPETLASYEAIVRRIVTEGHAPVVPVIFPFLWNVKQGNTDGMKRREAHLEIAKAYGTVAGDAVALGIERVKAGTMTTEGLWPVDGVHPGDAGYRMFADAAWNAFERAVREKRVCRAPEKMLHADTYTRSARVRISTLVPLPEGWRAGRPNVVSAYFDMLMSRWLDDEVIVRQAAGTEGGDAQKKETPPPIAPLKVRFSGSMVMVFGESTPTSGTFLVRIDGKPVEHRPDNKKPPTTVFDAGHLAQLVKGNAHLAQVIATGLAPEREHTLEIIPGFEPGKDQELRLESICVAGGDAWVRRDAGASN